MSAPAMGRIERLGKSASAREKYRWRARKTRHRSGRARVHSPPDAGALRAWRLARKTVRRHSKEWQTRLRCVSGARISPHRKQAEAVGRRVHYPGIFSANVGDLASNGRAERDTH